MKLRERKQKHTFDFYCFVPQNLQNFTILRSQLVTLKGPSSSCYSSWHSLGSDDSWEEGEVELLSGTESQTPRWDYSPISFTDGIGKSNELEKMSQRKDLPGALGLEMD